MHLRFQFLNLGTFYCRRFTASALLCIFISCIGSIDLYMYMYLTANKRPNILYCTYIPCLYIRVIRHDIKLWKKISSDLRPNTCTFCFHPSNSLVRTSTCGAHTTVACTCTFFDGRCCCITICLTNNCTFYSSPAFQYCTTNIWRKGRERDSALC